MYDLKYSKWSMIYANKASKIIIIWPNISIMKCIIYEQSNPRIYYQYSFDLKCLQWSIMNEQKASKIFTIITYCLFDLIYSYKV